MAAHEYLDYSGLTTYDSLIKNTIKSGDTVNKNLIDNLADKEATDVANLKESATTINDGLVELSGETNAINVTLTNSYDNTTEDLRNLSGSATTINNDLTGLSGATQSINTDLSNRITINDNAISDIRDNVGGITTTTENLDDRLTSVEAQIAGAIAQLSGTTYAVDSIPTEGHSNNLVTSDGIYKAITAATENVAFIGDVSGSTLVRDFDVQVDTVWNKSQSLSLAQQKQARANIGLGNGDVDAIPTSGSSNVVISSGIYNAINEVKTGFIDAYDVSAHHRKANNSNAYSLSEAIATVPADYKKGGLSIKFISSTSGEYEEWRNTSSGWTTDTTLWMGVDNEPVDESINLLRSGSVYDVYENALYMRDETAVTDPTQFDPETQSLHIIPQELSLEQKQQARKNLGLGANGVIDVTPMSGSTNIVYSDGIYNAIDGNVTTYDVSRHNGGQMYNLAGAIAATPDEYKRAGIKLRFISDTTSGYTEYSCISSGWTENVSGWTCVDSFSTGEYLGNVGIDSEPTAGSSNLVQSGGVADGEQVIKDDITVSDKVILPKGILENAQVRAAGIQANNDTNLIYSLVKAGIEYTINTGGYVEVCRSAFCTQVPNIGISVTDYSSASYGRKYTPQIDGYLVVEASDANVGIFNISKEKESGIGYDVYNLKQTVEVLSDTDEYPTEGSEKLVKSGGVYDSVKSLVSLEKTCLNTIDIGYNLIAISDIKPADNNYWASGQINEIGNLSYGNKVKFTSVGTEGSWQNYITCFLKVSDIKDRTGIDLSDETVTHYIDLMFNSIEGNCHCQIALRYEENDKTIFDRGTSIDVVFNSRGNISGLGKDDTTTWSDSVFNPFENPQTVTNLKLPYTYKTKTLYAILICISGNDGQKEIQNISVHFHSFAKNSIAFYKKSNDEEIAEIQTDLDLINKITLPVGENGYYAAIGDSITNANHGGIIDIEETDPYLPIDGYSQVSTYKRKNYAYFVAKRFNLKWANYGWGGTTLHDCTDCPSVGNEVHPFVNDDRLKTLKEGIDWDFISIFFGWNDLQFGLLCQREKWLKEQYGQDIRYTDNPSLIGTDGYVTQEQKDACDAVTGTFNGVFYDNAENYFVAKMIGTINDTVKDTYMGAYNIVLEYLMQTYTNSKIVIVVPFLGSHGIEFYNAVTAIAEKWGVCCFDFEELPYWYRLRTLNQTPLPNPNTTSGRWGGENGAPAKVFGYNRWRLSADGTHPSNLGYKMMAGPFGNKLYC